MSPAGPLLGPVRTRTRLTPVGRAVAFVAILALLVPGARLVGASALALLLLAPLLAARTVRRLRAGSPSAACCMAGEDVELRLPIENGAIAFTARDVSLHQPSDGRDRLRASAFVPALAPGESAETRPVFRSTRRGRRREYEFVALSTFPFGLAFSLAEFLVPADLLVLPRPGSVADLSILGGAGCGSPPRRLPPLTDEGDFRSLREWREGESQRLVHWKATARRGRTVVRELVSEDVEPIHLVLAAGVAHIERRSRAERALERAVNVAATLVGHFLRKGHRVRLSVEGPQPAATTSHRGRRGLFPLLAVLAEVEPAFETAVRFPAASGSRNERAVVVLAGRRRAVDAEAAGPRTLVLFADDPGTRAAFNRVPAPGARTVLGVGR